MTRDTFDRFTPPERGRFGDNEIDIPQSDDVERVLFQHASTPLALMLSTNGNAAQAIWIPRKFVKQVSPTHYRKVGTSSLIEAEFSLPRWKAKELGWLTDEDDERQGRLVL
jgi:hypothetical protein